MFLRSLRLLSGGEEEIFPNTKAASHLQPRWITKRTPMPPPGVGYTYVTIRHTPTKETARFSNIQPDTYETRRVTLKEAQELSTHQKTLSDTRLKMHRYYHGPKFSSSLADIYLRGVNGTLHTEPKEFAHKYQSTIAKQNIIDAKASELLAKTRTFAENQRPLRHRPGYVPIVDGVYAGEYIGRYVNNLRKLQHPNPNGYTREVFPWELMPLHPLVPPKTDDKSTTEKSSQTPSSTTATGSAGKK